MAIIEQWSSGSLEKGGSIIRISDWEKHDDGTLILFSGDDRGFERDKMRFQKDKNRTEKINDNIFIAANIPWVLTKGTKIVLRNREKDKEAIISQDTECDVSDCVSPKDDERFKGKSRIWCIKFKDISAWTFEPFASKPKAVV